jgi:hypothetical protein
MKELSSLKCYACGLFAFSVYVATVLGFEYFVHALDNLHYLLGKPFPLFFEAMEMAHKVSIPIYAVFIFIFVVSDK